MCSGIEAASVAWHSLGWTPVGFSEIEPFPCAVLAHHFPKVTNYGDMSKFRDWSIRAGDIDLLVGGTPCQSFSVAGLRQGLKDPRGNLMLTFLAIAEHLKPKWILWENVPGVLSSNGGKDFASFLGALGQLGYGFAYRVLDAQWCRTHGHPRAVPQRRRRVFVVGCLGDQRSAAKVLFESESLQRYSAKSKATRQGTAADVEEGIGSGGDIKIVADVATVDARNNCDRGDSQHLDRLIPCWWDGENTASTLTKSNASGAQRMPDKDNFGAVLQPVLFENHPNDSRVTGPHDVAPSCVSRYGTGGGNVPLVIPDVHAVAVGCFKSGQSAAARSLGFSETESPTLGVSGGNAIPAVAIVNMQGSKSNACVSTDGSSYTINAMHGHDVHAVAFRTNAAGQVDPQDGISASLGTQTDPCAQILHQAMQVRRLTPTECERLQGFPDGFNWKRSIRLGLLWRN